MWKVTGYIECREFERGFGCVACCVLSRDTTVTRRINFLKPLKSIKSYGTL